MPGPHVCLFLFICAGGRLQVCDLNTSAGEHLCVLQICTYVLPCGAVYVCVFKLLAGWIKYSWWHGGIGCRAKSGLTGTSRAPCVLKRLAPPSLSLYKEMSRGRGYSATASLLALSSHTHVFNKSDNNQKEGSGSRPVCRCFADVLV